MGGGRDTGVGGEGMSGEEGGAPLLQSKKIENASKNSRHFSIFVPLMGVEIPLEASVHAKDTVRNNIK